MRPDTRLQTMNRFVRNPLSAVLIAVLLAGVCGNGWAQGQMRKSLGPEPGRLAPALNDDDETEEAAEDCSRVYLFGQRAGTRSPGEV